MTISNTISPALKAYEPYYERILKTGSRVICSPSPDNTDEDYLVLCTPQGRHELETRLITDGWVLGGSLPNPVNLLSTPEEFELNTTHQVVGGKVSNHKLFHSWKRFETPAVYAPLANPESLFIDVVSPAVGPEINLLVTCNEQYFDDFTRATFLCQGLNLLDKADRVTVFEALTRDVWPTGPKKKKKSNLLYEKYGRSPVEDIFYGDVNTVNNFTGTPIQPLQVDMQVNPTIVAHNILPAIVAHNILPGAVFEAQTPW